jgi:hypothetical protein
MTSVRLLCAAAMAVVLAGPAAPAQPPTPKPGPEFDVLKKLEGNWDLTMKAEGMEFKGTVNYKMEVGGLWLVSSLECDMAGQKFYGKGLDTYDAGEKKYISVWADSMATQPMIMKGDYDKGKKALILTGEGPGPDGKPAKWKSTSVMPDDNTINFSMFVGDGKEPMFTIVYKRKK